MNITALEALYRESTPDGHYFDKATLAFFGSTQRKAVVRGGGAILRATTVISYTERQAKSPGMSWRCQLFTMAGAEIPGATGAGNSRADAAAAAIRAMGGE